MDSHSDDILADQVAEARAALRDTLEELPLDAAMAADLRKWVRRYPWPALGAAAAAGFTAANFVFASPGSDERLTPTETDQGPDPRTGASRRDAAGERPRKTGRVRSALFHSAFDLAKFAVTQLVSAYAYGAAQRPNVSPEGGSPTSHRETATSDPAAAR